MANQISKESLSALRVAIELRVSYLRERVKVDTTPEGLAMWPAELEKALQARREIYAYEALEHV